jgi:Concanavalin A-like lectin/glucanases superfamily
MSALLPAAPLIVFVIVVLFAFVGCELPTKPTGPDGPPGGNGPPPDGGDGPPGEGPGPKPPTPYQDVVLADGPIAYWRLGDSDKSQPAKDEIGPAPGDHPGVFNSSNGDLLLQQAGLNSSDPGAPSALFDGGYVSVDVAGKPELATPAFTIEALVVAEWPPGAGAGGLAVMHVVASSAHPSALSGWALFATDDDRWQGRVWGGGQVYETPKDQTSVVFSSVTYLALTYDGNGALMLFAGPAGALADALVQGCQYTANTTEPLSIGVGLEDTQPLFAFKGRIQEVALYGVALSKTQVADHFQANQ